MLAPSLRLDNDPYAVFLSAGKLLEFQEYYTVSNYFPYANPERTTFGQSSNAATAGQVQDPDTGAKGVSTSTNYIRNSVKVVVDMYDGTTTHFYVMDPKDPVLAAYRLAVFIELSELSADLEAPALSRISSPSRRTNTRTFHMTDPQVFLQQEAPMEKYEGWWSPTTS